MDPKFIVKYVRDKENRPIGCIVAIDRNILGCCFVNKADRPKSKKEMLEYAKERAYKAAEGRFKVSMDKNDFVHNNDFWTIPNCMRKDYEYMKERSTRYFKEED